jgi:CheY-like chemotaxis protein
MVDDNEDMLYSTEVSLKHLGCNYLFLSASNVEKAMQIIKKDVPDLILLDLMMPKTDGWKFSSMLKGDDLYKGIPIIIVTAKTDAKDKQLSKFVAEYFIEKPFDSNELKEKIESIIGE